MTDQILTPTEARKHIADLLTALAKDADTSTIRGHFHNRGYPHLDEAAIAALRRLISTATVAVTWPNHTTTDYDYDCGICAFVPTVTGTVRATQRGCPVHGEPRPIPTLEDRMTAPDRIPVDCIRLGCGHTADQHHRMAGDTADTRSQDRAIRELTAERDQARENAEYYYGMLGTVAAERDDALASLRDVLAELRDRTAELRAAQEQIAMHSTPTDEQTTEPDDDADLADALERAESVRIDRDDSIWRPVAHGWKTQGYNPLTLDRLEALFGPTRAVLLVDIEQDDEQEATTGLGSPADRAQDIRPAAWEQQAIDAAAAGLGDAWSVLATDPTSGRRLATAAVRAIIDAGLAGDGGRCPQCGTRYPRTMPAGEDQRCWTCATEEVAGLDEYAGRAQGKPAWDHEIAFDEDGDWSIGHPDGCPGQFAGDCDVYRLAFDQVDAGFFNRYAGSRFQCDVNDLRDLFLLGDRIHGDRCIAEAASGMACATCGCWCHDAQDPDAPAESAQDGRTGAGEGEQTQEAAQPTWDDCAMVANALNAAPGTGEIWRSTYGDIVGEPLSLARVAVEALTNAGRIAAPAEQAEG